MSAALVPPKQNEYREREVAVSVLDCCSAAGPEPADGRHKVEWTAQQPGFVVLCPRDDEHVMCASHLDGAAPDQTVRCWRCGADAPPFGRTQCRVGYVSSVWYAVEPAPRPDRGWTVMRSI